MTSAARVTLITGGARRVGAAIVRACAAEGDRVVIHASSSREEAEALAAELRANGAEVATVFGDLSDASTPDRIVQEAYAAFGQLDVLINSAANFVRVAPMDITPEAWDRSFAVNTRAPFFLAQSAARVMQSGGVIVNIADHAAFETMPRMIAHGAAKYALVHITRTLARALAPRIRVNAVAPGLVEAPEDFSDESKASFLRDVPLGRVGSGHDVAQAVRWLISAEYVTGAVIPVDGGRGVAK